MPDIFSWREMQVVNVIKPVIFTACRFIAGIRLKIKNVFPNSIKRVLLAGTSEVTVFDLLDVDEIIEVLDEDKKCFMLVSRETRDFARSKLSQYQNEIPLISLIQALCFPWDIIIFADHNNTRWFHPDIPKINYGHGLTSGKSHGSGGSWAFGQNALDRKGSPLYDLMFVESSYYQNISIQENPALQGRLAVVGSLMADKLILLNQEREIVRRKLSIQKEEQVFVIFSTWGPQSLIQRFGVTLLESIPDVAENFKVYFILHPLNDRDEFAGKGTILELLADYTGNGIAERVNSATSWFPYLVAADVVLTDHTSLSLYYALLDKPLFFVPLASEVLTEESLIWQFYKLQKPYNPDMPLGCQLEGVIKNFSVEKHQELSHLLLDERGNAKQRICAEIARFW